jgi:hypothetical protein
MSIRFRNGTLDEPLIIEFVNSYNESELANKSSKLYSYNGLKLNKALCEFDTAFEGLDSEVLKISLAMTSNKNYDYVMKNRLNVGFLTLYKGR